MSLDSNDEAQKLRPKLAELNRREQAISAEYSLARNPASYLLVNLAGRIIELRLKGRVLRSFILRDVKKSAPLEAANRIWVLADVSPLQQIERHSLTPGAGEEATAAAAKQALWGPHRMPSDYDLVCDKRNILEIRTALSESAGSSLFKGIPFIYRRLVDGYRHWKESRGAEPRYSIQIWLTENDAQMLFWSLPKHLSILVLDGVREMPEPMLLPP